MFVERQESGGFVVHGHGGAWIAFDPLEWDAARDCAARLGKQFALATGRRRKRAYRPARFDEESD